MEKLCQRVYNKNSIFIKSDRKEIVIFQKVPKFLNNRRLKFYSREFVPLMVDGSRI